jgi:hypothetical protein
MVGGKVPELKLASLVLLFAIRQVAICGSEN